MASISLDLDNKWSYMKIHGDAGWENYPSYLDLLIPPVLDLFDEEGVTATWFIVGRDAAAPENRLLLRRIVERGHEIGNHSYEHDPWLDRYGRDRIEGEIKEAHLRIAEATGQEPRGFRGPGFSWSDDLIEVLGEQGYLYDASSLATFIGPLARLYYFWKSRLDRKEQEERKRLFGTLKEGFRSNKPYVWRTAGGADLAEIPVTTIPGVRTPFHLSYLLFLASIDWRLMLGYLRFALFMCRATGTEPSFLLHPLDFLDGEQVPELRFFPAMNLGRELKCRAFKAVTAELRVHFELGPMTRHAERVLAASPARRVLQTGSRVA